ncbi:MAG: 50S ribosomal protein L21 [Dehalococcoidia bacterium]|nr:50S ribosomal protein L21 [Dehalococcoidia bacterium]
MYAIVETGGKQYRVSPGQTIEVERLSATEGSSVELDKVLCIADGDNVTLGAPTVEGAKVIATSQGEAKGDKIVVFRYKPKVRYSIKTGHRQLHTRLVIDKIVGPGMATEEPMKKPRRRKGVTKDGT